ncbi:unnamed protein product [Citrullus colocynthis]|uniref:Uncharacterized protein n=1 Tax=Citrullus colocynthis TaxID=252529 RepID=A0ABP0YCK2_9ROSI
MTYPEPEGYGQSLHVNGQATPAEVGLSSTSTNVNSFKCHNVDGIAEVLLALERIEQEELTYEELVFTSLLSSIFKRQLLDLEERKGTVSTTLSEEALTECLNRSIYQSKPKGETTTVSNAVFVRKNM